MVDLKFRMPSPRPLASSGIFLPPNRMTADDNDDQDFRVPRLPINSNAAGELMGNFLCKRLYANPRRSAQQATPAILSPVPPA